MSIYISMYTTMQIIRLIAALGNDLKRTPKWNIIQKFKLQYRLKKYKKTFFSRDIFDQLESSFSIIMNMMKNSHQLISIPSNIILRTSKCMIIKFQIKQKDELLRKGKIQFIIDDKKSKVIVDLEHTPNKRDGLVFTYVRGAKLIQGIKQCYMEICMPVLHKTSNELLETIIRFLKTNT